MDTASPASIGTSAPPLPAASRTLMARLRAQLASGQPEWQTRDQAQQHIPVQRYFDAAIWQAELKALFGPLPLVAAHSSELAPGQVLAHDGYGVPLLLCREADGSVRCFLNVCRHRGMRLVDNSQPQARASLVCPYHGWTYRLDGRLRHMLHAESFDACPEGARDLVPRPCAERHGLIWVAPGGSGSTLDVAAYLQGLDAEMPFYGVDQLQHFRTVQADYPANWKLIVDAFLEPYHIRVLHKDSIYPFFTDGITAAERFGPHIHSLVARRAAQDWAAQPDSPEPATLAQLRRLATPSQVIFPNTVTIFHPDYLSLITLYPTGPETLRWTHRMLIPADKATPDWAPHWEKTFQLIDQGVFQAEDIRCAIGIQQGLKTGANQQLTVGRMEQALAWFHQDVQRALG
jgi:phenylpropionate dioxygenase-like ring-hydroxylating dioxygenase large terminal subunit